MAGTIGAFSTILGGGAKAGMSLMGGMGGGAASTAPSFAEKQGMLSHINTLPTFGR